MPGKYERSSGQVYLSYGDPDEGRVAQLYERLLAARLNPWMRSRDIRAGTDARSTIAEAIERSDLFVVILSSESAPDSEEIDEILRRAEPYWLNEEGVIPVLLDEDCEVPDNSVSVGALRSDQVTLAYAVSEDPDTPANNLSAYAAMDLSDSEGWEPLLDRLDPFDRSSLPELAVPDDLVQACVDDQCVLFSGEGLSTLAGFPPRRAFILRLLDWAMENDLLLTDVDWLPTWREEVKTGDAELIANNIYEALYHPFEAKTAQTSSTAETHKRLEPLYAYLRDIYARPGPPPPESPVLTEVGFTAAMTTNIDQLLEAAFVDADPPHFTSEDTEGLREAFAKHELFILKLYGSVEEPDTLCVARAQFEDTVRRNEPFLQFIQTLFLSRSVLFVGADLEAINTFLEAIQLRRRVEAPQHFALVPVLDSAWQAQADSLRRRYGIRVLPYAPLDERQVRAFLKELAERVQTRQLETVAIDTGPARLRGLRLENIGPFEVLELELDPHWNIMLGDNGVGKSSILKAIAVGIAGKDAQPYAHRLIRSGETSATITLETTEGARYVTEIVGTDGGAEVRSRTVRPLDAEGWLALGFPPLRTFSWTRPKGPDPQESKRRPTSNDLLPLVADELDPRMDGLKQWVMNLDYWSSKQPDVGTGDVRRYRRLLKEFFQVVDQLTEDVTVRLDEDNPVNPKTGEITIITDDGPVPIETLSQGTESLIGWTGILLRRLYEMYGDDEENFRDKYALVLMDELDAHMHPAWQQTLVTKLKRIFRNVQFIATTHSPLIVIGAAPEEVYRLRRGEDDPNSITFDKPRLDLRRWRADQVLTSPLFGLPSTIAPEMDRAAKRYTELSAQDDLSETEEEELRTYAEMLDVRPPAPQERREAREAFEMIEEALEEQLKDIPVDEQRKLLEEAKVQIQENITGSRRPL